MLSYFYVYIYKIIIKWKISFYLARMPILINIFSCCPKCFNHYYYFDDETNCPMCRF